MSKSDRIMGDGMGVSYLDREVAVFPFHVDGKLESYGIRMTNGREVTRLRVSINGAQALFSTLKAMNVGEFEEPRFFEFDVAERIWSLIE